MPATLGAVSDDVVEVFTDGSCLGNPGPGGWGAVLRWRGEERELFGGERETTNNRMELTAAIEALNSLTRPVPVVITTDSSYVKDGIQKWLQGWKRRNWRTASNQPVKNKDLWQQLDELVQRYDVTWEWVKGHSGHPENERADDLARRGAEEARG